MNYSMREEGDRKEGDGEEGDVRTLSEKTRN